jgi:flavin reductase (DIM6/NTAB) family NADH-FMN oxidoreductase RutF
VDAYDHILFIGEIVRAERGREAPPLLFFRSAYAVAEGSDRLHLGTREKR